MVSITENADELGAPRGDGACHIHGSVNSFTYAAYLYNGDGLRTPKTVGATTTDFTWDPSGLGTVIHVDDGTVDDDYLWGLGLIGRIDGAGNETYACSDA